MVFARARCKRRWQTHPHPNPPLEGEGLLCASVGTEANVGLAAKRILKWIGIAFLALVLVTGALLFWLLDTESGARFALARAVGAMEGKLSFERSSGRLAGPLSLVNVRYARSRAPASMRASASVVVDLNRSSSCPSACTSSASISSDADVALTTVPPKPERNRRRSSRSPRRSTSSSTGSRSRKRRSRRTANRSSPPIASTRRRMDARRRDDQ